MELIGLKTCDSCRAALKALEAAGHAVDFRDIRKNPLGREDLEALLGEHGEALVNRRSTTWRGLDDAEREREPIALLLAHATLMKRPVIRRDGASYLGLTPGNRRALGLG